MTRNLRRRWLSRKPQPIRGRALRRAKLCVGQLEDRTVPTSTVFLDFGQSFPAGGLAMTVEQLADDLNGPNFNSGDTPLDDDTVLTFTPYANFVTFDYNGDGFTNATDVSDLRNAVVSLVQRYYAPFDVNVVVAPALDGTDSDTYRQGIIDTLEANDGDSSGEFDAWALIAGLAPSQGGFGLAPGDDSGSGNDRDDTVLVYADAILGSFGNATADTALAYTSAHEPGHALGLEHTDAGTSDNDLLTRSDMVVDGASGDANHNRQNLDFFTRYNLPKDPEDGGGVQNNYDIFVGDDDIGAKAGFAAYVTGTGAFDKITITRTNATDAAVSVEAHRDNTFANQIGATYNYNINYTNGILIDGGFSQDRIIIDANLGVTVTVRGMAGNDQLVVMGNGVASGSYTPSASTVVGLDGNTNFSGTVLAGSTTIKFDEFEAAGSITVQDIASFNVIMPSSVDVLTVDSPAAGQNRVSGTTGGVSIVPITFFNVTSLTIDTGANDGLSNNADTITINASGLVAAGLQNFTVSAGNGDDQLQISASSFSLPVAGGTFAFQGGSGTDKVSADANVDFNLSDSSLAIPGNGSIALTSVEQADLRGGASVNTFTVSNWTGSAFLNARGGGDHYVVNLKGSGAGSTDINDSGASGADTVEVNGTGLADTIGVTNTQVSRAAETVSYANVESLTVNAGASGDTINVRSTLAGMIVTVNGDDGDDVINVGNLADSLDNIQGLLTVNGNDPTASDALNINDQGDTDPHVYVITATTVDRSGAAQVTYGTVETLTVNGASGGNTVNVRSTASGTTTLVNTGAGNDDISVDSNGAAAGGTVDGVVSSLTINGQGGTNTLLLEDFDDPTGDVVHVTPTQIGADPTDTFFGTGGHLTYSGLQAVTLDMSNGYFPDTIYLIPSATTTFTVHGNDPHCPMNPDQLPGDALYLDFTGVINPHLEASGNGPGVWTFDNREPVAYDGIEKMNHVQVVVVSPDVGESSPVQVLSAETGELLFSFFAFEVGYKGGVRVGVGDVNCDAIPDIMVAAGPNRAPEVRIFNGATGELMGSFFAYDPGSKNGLYIAVGDINQDGFIDIVTGSDSGNVPLVKVFSGQDLSLLHEFFAYTQSFNGGVRLAVGDINGDSVPDIITAPGPGFAPLVKVFNGVDPSLPLIGRFLAFGANFSGGLYVAVGDVTGDGRADIVVGQDKGGSHLSLFDGTTLTSVLTFQPYGSSYNGGVRVAVGDVDGDGQMEVFTAAGAGNKAPVKALRYTGLVLDEIVGYFDDDPLFIGKRFVAAG